MELNTSTLMMGFFVIALAGSIWKIWAFMPNKQLIDDDTTPESQAKLEVVLLKVIHETEGKLNEKELFEAILIDEEFDKELFWRFNLNKHINLLNAYYAKVEDVDCIEAIYISRKDENRELKKIN